MELKERRERTFRKKPAYPTHTDFYRNLHRFENMMVREIFAVCGLTFERTGLFGKSQTAFDVEIEKEFWDVIVTIRKTPDRTLNRMMKKASPRKRAYPLLLEYKSSTKEWGKQIDAFFRQIKKRRSVGIPILITFDPAFREYAQACKRAKICLVILSENCLEECSKEAGE